MAAQIDVFNMALILMGEEPVSAPSQDTKAARTLLRAWDITRQSLLRSHRWGFAMKRDGGLAALATPPASQFAYQFNLPADFLRLDFVGEHFVGASLTDYRTTDESLYALAAGSARTTLETNIPAPLPVRYVADITNSTQWDACFTDAMAALLGLRTAKAVANSQTAAASCADALGKAITAAMAANAIERPPVGLADNEWMLSRL